MRFPMSAIGPKRTSLAALHSDVKEIESVIATHAREPNGGLMVMPDSFMDAHPGLSNPTSSAAPNNN